MGCGGETEQELGLEIVDQRPVTLSGGVVELVDDNVVELLAAESLEVGPRDKVWMTLPEIGDPARRPV